MVIRDFVTKKNEKIKFYDLAVAGVLAIFTLGFVTTWDIALHDSYVLPSYQCDDPNAPAYNSDYCQNILDKTTIKVPFTEFAYEYEGRDVYWIMLNLLIFFIGGVGAFIRTMIGSMPAGILWFITIIIPVFAGYEDFLYFTARGIEIPEELPWLEGNVYISIVNGLIAGEGATVTVGGLFASMASMFAVLLPLWFFTLRREEELPKIDIG